MTRSTSLCKLFSLRHNGPALLAAAILAQAGSALCEDYTALYKKLSADVIKCTENKDPNLRIKCFDKIAYELDLKHSLFPIKEATPTPEKDPFEITARPPEKK